MKKIFIILSLLFVLTGCNMTSKEELANKIKILHPEKRTYTDGVDFFVILDENVAIQYRTSGSSWVLKRIK